MNNEDITYFERRLIAELEKLEIQLRELEAEKLALQRQLAKARAERSGLPTSVRKNSLNRVLAENSVLQALRRHRKPLSTKLLFREAQSSNFDLKEATFRTYLHRMKKKGLIKMADRVGVWKLS